jgi:TolA-binding protein
MYDKAVLGIGTELVEKGEHKKALEYLKGFMEENPNASVAAPIYLKIAEIYETHLEQPRKAMETYSRMLEDYSKDRLFSYAAYRYGMLLVKLKKGDEAKEVFEKVEKKDKSIYRAAQAEIGKLLAKTDPEAAIENYRAIVAESETQEDSATAMIGIGDVYVAIKKWEDAAGAFNDVYDFYTGQDTTLLAGALVKWVDALLNAKKYKEAVEVAQIMQNRFPENSFTINTLYYEANAYFSMGKYGKAREVFGKIIESDKSEQLTEIAYYQRADAYYFAAARVKNESVRRNQFLAAIRGYNEYIKKYPGGKYKPRALYMQGNAYWTLEDFPKAKVNFEKVINNYPDFGEICSAKNFLAYSLNKLDQWKAALKIYNQVRRGGGCNAKTVKFANEQAELIIGQH